LLSIRYILQGWVWCLRQLRFSFHCYVSFGQEGSSKSAPTICANRYFSQHIKLNTFFLKSPPGLSSHATPFGSLPAFCLSPLLRPRLSFLPVVCLFQPLQKLDYHRLHINIALHSPSVIYIFTIPVIYPFP
jgi:hypothetical protein